MQHLRRRDGQKRQDQGGQATMALPSLRRILDTQGGQQGEGVVAVSEMAVLQGHLGADGPEQNGILEKDFLGVVPVADRPLHRRGA